MQLSAKLRRYAKHHAPAYAWAREAAETQQALQALQDERAQFLLEVEAEKARLQRHAAAQTSRELESTLAMNRRAASLDARERKLDQAEAQKVWKMPGPPPVTRYVTPAAVTPGANTPSVHPPAGSRVHTSSRAKPL